MRSVKLTESEFALIQEKRDLKKKLKDWDTFWAARTKAWRKEQDKAIAAGHPVGTCSSCKEENTICDYSCVGV